MKIVTGILSALLGLLCLYLFFSAKEKLDLAFAIIVLLTSIIFLLFSIMEEMKEDLSNLRKRLWGRL